MGMVMFSEMLPRKEFNFFSTNSINKCMIENKYLYNITLYKGIQIYLNIH